MPDPDNEVPSETAYYEGWYSRLRCGGCENMFEVDDDVQNGEVVECDACGAKLAVSRVI